MRQNFCLVVPVLLGLFCNPTCASDSTQVLFMLETDVTYVGGRSGIVDPQSERDFPHFSVNSSSPPTQNNTLADVFHGLMLGLPDVGNTKIATPTSPGFVAFTQLLTDGQEQWLTLPSGPNATTTRRESNWFHPASNTAIDLNGYTIDQITYTITSWYYETPGRDPNHNGFWTDTYYGYRVTIEGHPIPEPCTMGFIALSVGALPTMRIRRPSDS